MADDMEKTEEPTPKKIEDAKKEGNVPKSQEISSFITLVVALIAVFVSITFVTSRLEFLYHFYISEIGHELTKNRVFHIALISFRELIFMVIPISLIVAISGIIAAVIQFGFIYTTKPLTPNLNKINPIKGFAKLFSLKKLLDGLKITLKVSIVFFIAFHFLIKFIKELPTVINYDFFNQIKWLSNKILILALIMLLIFLILSLIDLLIVRFQYFKDLRMSKQEIKDEFKQMEGDPLIKSKIKQIQMQIAQKRMMNELPSADVVITNPTHYAVALRYDKEKENAPRVVAKGVDNLALKIKELARENFIQIVENPPLARELYGSTQLNEIIPDNLFKAVAEILAFVYKTNNKKIS